MLQASLCDGACSSLPGAQAQRFRAPDRRKSLRLRLISASSSAQERGGSDSGFPTTKVKFVLRKQCMFGEHFKVIGAHSALGEWDPDAAVQLEWSEGHNWTAELEVPQGGKFEYKFVRKSKDGAIHWQPGPNRVFSTLRKPSSLVVAQGWDFDQTCAVIEEEQEYVSSSEKNELPESATAEDPNGATFLTLDNQVRVCEEPAVVVPDKQELQTTEERQESGSVGKPESEEAGGVSSQDKQEIQLQNEQTVDSQQNPDQDVSRQHERQNEDSQEESMQDERHQADADFSCIGDPFALGINNCTSKDSTGSALDGAPNQICERSKDKAPLNGDTEPPPSASLTLWQKDRNWFAKVITAIASFFKR